jgi:energy-converting hydrogenase Eha subunit A
MGVYLLTANDRLQSADGYAILATAQTGNINIMGAVDYLIVPHGRMGTFGLDGNLYSKKGITPSLALAPLVWLSDLLPNAPLQATAHLFNGVVSTLTALILFGVVIRLGYEKRVAFIVALMFGLGTLTVVYARTLFGEPLAGLLIMLCVWMAMPYPFSPNNLQSRRDMLYRVHSTDGKNAVLTSLNRLVQPPVKFLWLGILLGLLAGINLTYIAFVPIFVVYVVMHHPQKMKNLILLGVGFVFTVGILVGWVNLSRYGSFTATGYKFSTGEGFTTPLLTGLYGQFFSTWRGIIWYAPLMIILPVGLWLFFRTYRALTVFIIICIVVQTVIYAMWWSWSGGVVWGARFLVPIIPLAMLAFAPMVKFVLHPPDAVKGMIYHAPTAHHMRLLVGGLLVLLFILSFAIQLIGTLYDFNIYEGMLYNVHLEKFANAFMFHPELSPILGHITMLQNGEPLNWWWAKYGDMWGLASATLIILCGMVLMVIRKRAMQGVALMVVCVGMLIFALRGEADADKQKRAELQTALNPPAPIIATTDDTLFMNLFGFRDISTIFAPTPPDEPFTRQLWQNAIDNGGLRWFVTWFNPANPDNWAEKELFTDHAFVKEVWAGGYRGVLFYLHPPVPKWIASAWQFGDVVILNQYALQQDANGIFVTLDWGLSAPLPPDWGWFVHLLDVNGQIITQQDRIPLGGYMPNAPSVLEQLYFITPPQNAVSVRIGWAQNGALVPIDGVSDGFIVLPILP